MPRGPNRNPPPTLRGHPVPPGWNPTHWFAYRNEHGDWPSPPAEAEGTIGPLYHATVSVSGVLAGIKHRKGSKRKGIGGGTSVAVSFTQDRKLACEIARCLVEAIKVANDVIGWDDLIEMAKRDGVLDLAAQRWRNLERGTYKSETDIEVVETARRGLMPVDIGLGFAVAELPAKGLMLHPHAPRWMGRDEEYTSGYALRRATPEEDREARFTFYRAYLSAAGSARKRTDPLFFSVYAEDMRGNDPADVGVIEAWYDGGVMYPKANTLDWKIEDGQIEPPPGMFTYLPSMDEYRIYDLSRLRITGTIECSMPVSTNPQRWNSDERFRELERRVAETPGDGTAWTALVREAARTGRGFDQEWIGPFVAACRDPRAWEIMVRAWPHWDRRAEWEQPLLDMLGPLHRGGLMNWQRSQMLSQIYYRLATERRGRENMATGSVAELAAESEDDRTSQLFGGFFTRPSYADPLEDVAAIDADRLTQLQRSRGGDTYPPQRGDIWIPHWLVSGDYWQGDSHSRANRLAFLERWGDTPGVYPVTGSYSLEAVAIILGNDYPPGMVNDLRESMEHGDLEEVRRLNLEHEEQAQAWEAVYKHDWPRVLANTFPSLAADIEELGDEALRSLFDSGVEVIERSRSAWDSGPQGATIDLDDVAQEVDEEDIRAAIKKHRRGKRPNPWSISKTFTFEAAHYLPGVPEGHKCRRLHGHSYAVTVELRNDELDQAGMVLDYGEVSQIVKPIVDGELDHRLLNEIEGLENPTAEAIARWLYDRLEGRLPWLWSVTVKETAGTASSYWSRETSAARPNPRRKRSHLRLLSLRPSRVKGKKWAATFLNKRTGRERTTHFGATGYQDYTMHRDPERKERYLERHGRGREDWNDPTSAGALSRWILWNLPTIEESVEDFRRRFGL